jgi:hypothetical protein
MDDSKAARIAVVRHGDDEQSDPAVVPACLQQLVHPRNQDRLARVLHGGEDVRVADLVLAR